ncbi:MAG TPA: cytochrome c [bacterium]|nr:cytochrome c [bacterium]
MNSNRSNRKVYLVGCLAGLMTIALFLATVVVWAAAQPKPPDYQGYDLARPWFDGKPWDWFLDMVNQPSIKPQEVGTMERFPTDSVPTTGVEPDVPNVTNSSGLLRDQIPVNPVKPTAASIADGRKIFDIYCAACHGRDGKAQTPVAAKGMPAIPIDQLRLVFSEAHIYNKIRYGGPIMPTYGFQTSQRERWDIVNYMKSQDFGK